MPLRFTQIVSCQWEDNNGGLKSTIFALDINGEVFKLTKNGWIKTPMKEIQGDAL